MEHFLFPMTPPSQPQSLPFSSEGYNKKEKEICITPPPTAVAASPRYPQSIIMQYNNVDASHV
jgi:hypothetical protein